MNPSANFKTNECKGCVYKKSSQIQRFCKAAFSRPIEPGTIIEIPASSGGGTDDGEYQSAAGGSGSSGKPERTFGVKLEVGGKG